MKENQPKQVASGLVVVVCGADRDMVDEMRLMRASATYFKPVNSAEEKSNEQTDGKTGASVPAVWKANGLCHRPDNRMVDVCGTRKAAHDPAPTNRGK